MEIDLPFRRYNKLLQDTEKNDPLQVTVAVVFRYFTHF